MMSRYFSSTIYLKKCFYLAIISYVMNLWANDYKYEIQDLGVVPLYGISTAVDLNDEGQVLLYCKDKMESWRCPILQCGDDAKIVLWDAQKGLEVIAEESNMEESSLSLYKINNLGWAGGNITYYIQKEDEEGHCQTTSITLPVLWSSQEGLKVLKILDSLNARLVDMNDHQQIVGIYIPNEKNTSCFKRYSKRIFIWEQEEARDLGIDQELINLGYYPLDYCIVNINNKGEILGAFSYGEKHPYKNLWREVGTKVFFWDGHVKVLEDIPAKNFQSYFNDDDDWNLEKCGVHLSDDSQVLVSGANYPLQSSFWKWEKNEDNASNWNLDNLPNVGTFTSISRYHSKLVGEHFHHFIIWDPQHHIYEKIYNEEQLLKLFDTSQYPELNSLKFIRVNNRGQILFQANFWNERHAFLLNPIE